MDSGIRALWLAAQTRDIQCYSFYSGAKNAYVTCKMASWFAAVTNEETSQIIEKAFPEIHEEGDEI